MNTEESRNLVPINQNSAPDRLSPPSLSQDSDDLLERIVSGEVQLNFGYLPLQAIDPPIIIDTANFPLIDPSAASD
jgi:hypothetical protein